MKRFRFTLLTVCLVLLGLGVLDLRLLHDNPAPLPVSIEELERAGAPREWLQIEGGVLDLEQAINPSGRVETFETGPFFVPLKSASDGDTIKVVIETRDPQIIQTLKTYVLEFDTAEARQAWLQENREAFHPQKEITGMTSSWLSATANRDKLLQLAREQNMPVSDDVIFVSEGKAPGKFRGYFFTVIAVLGIARFIQLMIQKKSGLAVEPPDDAQK